MEAQEFLEAAENRNFEELSKLLAQGIDSNSQDESTKNSALHCLLVDGCYCEDCTAKTEECIKLLVNYGADTNIENVMKKVPLDFAVVNMVPVSIVKLLMKHGATVVGSKGIDKHSLARKLVQRMPEAFVASLDQAVSYTPGEVPLDGARTLDLDWRSIIYRDAGVGCFRHWQETKFLNDILTHGNMENHQKHIILGHPLVRAFFELKSPLYWTYFGSHYCVWIILTFLAYMALIWYLYNQHCRYGNNEGNAAMDERWRRIFDDDEKGNNSVCSSDEILAPGTMCCQINEWLSIFACITAGLYVTGPIFLEWRKILTTGIWVWARQWQNYVFIPATVFLFITLFPVFRFEKKVYLDWQYPSAALGLLVGSISILIQLTPVPFVSIYLEMLFRVFLRILLASIAFFPLFVGFFLAFQILVTGKVHDFNPFSLLEMIVSDTDYEEMIDYERGFFYVVVTYFFFCVFIILVIVVVVNFLIGLAVSDIQELREKAVATNQTNLVRGFYLMDSLWGGNRSKNSVIRGGKELIFKFQPLNSYDTRLSTKLKLELLDIARRSHAQVVREKKPLAIDMGKSKKKSNKSKIDSLKSKQTTRVCCCNVQ